MIDEKWKGSKTIQVQIGVTRTMIRNFAKAIGDETKVYHDLEAANLAGYEDLLAPPTLPIIFWQWIDVPWLKEMGTIIHGKQHFYFEKDIIANQSYDCFIQLGDLIEKQGKSGNMQISSHDLIIETKGEYIGTASSTLIIKS